MVTGRLAKHCRGESCKTSLGEREGGRARPWRSGFGGLMDTHRHTKPCRWNWAPAAGGGRWASGGLWPRSCSGCDQRGEPGWKLPSAHLLPDLFRADRPGTTLPPSCWIPVAWNPKQAGTAKDLVFPVALSHGMESSAPLHITFHQLLWPQLFKAALQGPDVWKRNVFLEFYTEFRGFGWLLHGTCTVLCAEASPLFIQQLSRDLLCLPMIMEYSELEGSSKCSPSPISKCEVLCWVSLIGRLITWSTNR